MSFLLFLNLKRHFEYNLLPLEAEFVISKFQLAFYALANGTISGRGSATSLAGGLPRGVSN